MVVILVIGAVMAIGGVMLMAIGRLAKNREESPAAWTFGLALVWGFIAVVLKTGTIILGEPGSVLFQRWYPWLLGGCILLTFMTFALFWYLLDTRSRDNQLEDKVNEIGMGE